MKTILRFTAILALLAGVCFGQGTNSGLTVQVQNAGTPAVTAKKWLVLNCVSGLNCAYSNGVLGITVSGQTPTWDVITSPAGNQTLTMTGDSTTWNWGSTNTNQFKFDTSGNPTFGLVSATTAVTSSPTLSVCGSYQNAGTPTFAADCWTIQNVLGSGTNGTGILTISQSGTTGARQVRVTSFQSNSPVYAIGTSNTGIGQDGSNNLLAYSGGNMSLAVTGSTGVAIGSAQRYGLTSGAANGTVDTGVYRAAAGVVGISTGTASATAGFLQLGTTVVGSLPAAASGNKGQMIYVSDSTAVASEGQTCAGGSSNAALAFSNGTIWKCF